MICRVVVSFLAVLLAAVPLLVIQATAQDVIWVTEYQGPSSEACVLMHPGGDGPALTEARYANGTYTDATISFRLLDEKRQPIRNLPREDMWLSFAVEPGTASDCVGLARPGGEFWADAGTDEDGRAFFTRPLNGGGWSEGPAALYVNGVPAVDRGGDEVPDIRLQVNSPDINGDGRVDLTDVPLFVEDYYGAYHLRSDLEYDGQVNLADFAKLSVYIGLAKCR